MTRTYRNSNTRRTMIILLALLLILPGLSVFFPDHDLITSAEPGRGETIYVDDDAEPGGNGSLEHPYDSIGDGIAAAEDGDIVRVFEGTYNEKLIINDEISVTGNGSEDTIIDNENDYVHGVHLSSDNIEFSGFTVMGNGRHGIRVDTSGNRIFDNDVYQNGRSGIALTTSNDAGYNEIFSNVIHENGNIGIMIQSSTGYNEVIGNEVYSNSESGIDIFGAPENIISWNHVHQNDHGITFSAASDDNLLDNNTVDNNTKTGISIQGDDIRLSMNTVENNGDLGIDVVQANGAIIQHSSITGHPTGIQVRSDSQNVRVNGNDIKGNTVMGLDASSNDGSIVNATENWWGHFSGPYHGTQNPEGVGDEVSDDVQFDPWTGKRDPGEENKIYVDDDAGPDSDGSRDNPYRTINEALDVAKDGNEIFVYAGTYSEIIVVDLQVEIIGNGSNEVTIDGQGNGDVITINVDGVNLSGLRITGSGFDHSGLMIRSSGNDLNDLNCSGNHFGAYFEAYENNNVEDSTFMYNSDGLVLDFSQETMVRNNEFIENDRTGIWLHSSPDNTIKENFIADNNNTAGIFLSYSNGNMIVDNELNMNLNTAIFMDDSDGNTIQGNTLNDNAKGMWVESSQGNTFLANLISGTQQEGIQLFDSTSNHIVNNTCEGNREGIVVSEWSDNNRVENNLCINGTTGIAIDAAHGVILVNNTCSENEEGISIGRSDNDHLAENLIQDSQFGLYMYDCNGVYITNNTFLRITDTAINLTDSSECTLEYNIIGLPSGRNGNGEVSRGDGSKGDINRGDEGKGDGTRGNGGRGDGNGIGFFGSHSTDITIINNTIMDNEIGLLFSDDSTGQVHGNTISTNTAYGIKVHNSEPLNATHNFWGDTTGPFHATSNPDGTGDEVSDDITFDPWYDDYMIWAILESIHPMEIQQGERVFFRGTGLSHVSIIDRYSWSSSLSGEFYYGTADDFSITDLENGTHIISYKVQDDQGIWSPETTGVVIVNGKPRASIEGLPEWVPEGTDVTLKGNVTDDGTIVRYEWISSKEGLLYDGSNPQFIWSGVSRGDRILSFRVMDDRGIWSDTILVNFSVYRYPTAEIISVEPVDSIFGELVEFTGKGTADVAVTSYIWRSDKDNEIYNGSQANFNTDTLSNGSHTIYLRVIDENGLASVEVSTTVSINGRPVARIGDVSPNPAVWGESVTFKAMGTDDGSIVRYSWTSDLNEDFYSGSMMNYSTSLLGVGVHTLGLKVMDNQNIWSDEVTGTLIITMKPTAIIDEISPNPAFQTDQISFSGHGVDDGAIIQYSWYSSLENEIYNGTESSVNLSLLTPGTHTIEFRVMDNLGIWSDPKTYSLDISDNRKPVIQVFTPKEGDVVKGKVDFTGQAQDDTGLSRIEYQFQGDEGWKTIAGEKLSWSLVVDTSQLNDGDYTLLFRAYDGKLYSDTARISITVENDVVVGPDEGGDDDDEISQGFLLLVSAGLIILLAAVFGISMKRSSKNDGRTVKDMMKDKKRGKDAMKDKKIGSGVMNDLKTGSGVMNDLKTGKDEMNDKKTGIGRIKDLKTGKDTAIGMKTGSSMTKDLGVGTDHRDLTSTNFMGPSPDLTAPLTGAMDSIDYLEPIDEEKDQ